MSRFLHPYLLMTDKVRALVGCGKEDLLDRVRAYHAGSLAAADDEFSHAIEEGAPTAAEALRALVHGGPYESQEYSYQYAHAFEHLCSFSGEFLPNRSFAPFRGSWLDEVDKALEASGITAVSVSDFQYGSALPAGVPSTYEISCGEWSAEQCRKALEQYEQAEREGRAPALDRYEAEAVAEVVSWLRHAAADPGPGIIGFVH